jgi:hypothetical protein
MARPIHGQLSALGFDGRDALHGLSMFVCQGRIRPILLNRGVPDVLIFAPNRFDWPHEAFLKRQRRLLTAALFAMRRERPMGLLPDA